LAVELEEWEKDVEKRERQERLQKEWGLKFQIVAEPLLDEMRYTVIKAEHRSFKRSSRSAPAESWYKEKLGDYLWNYADYVVKKGGHLYVVDVKSQGYVPLLEGEDGDPITPDTISFSEIERREYSASKVPVQVLLMLYNSGGKVRKLPAGRMGVKGIVEYSEELDARCLGPLYYKIVPFAEFKFRDEIAGGILANKFQGCKKLASPHVCALLQKTRAHNIFEIGPGYVKREKEGRIVVEGLSPS